MKILAVGAHPDDIEIFMYGLIAACKQRGDEIILCVATDGAAGNIQINNNLKKIREKETLLGLAKVGIPCFLELIDGNLDGSLNAYKIICDFINDIKPDLVITHDPNDYHPDHRSLSKYITKSVGFKCPVLFAETLLGIKTVSHHSTANIQNNMSKEWLDAISALKKKSARDSISKPSNHLYCLGLALLCINQIYEPDYDFDAYANEFIVKAVKSLKLESIDRYLNTLLEQNFCNRIDVS